jgi:mannose-6-phosphate isomerase-like protein (cupin superfamily)
MNQEKYLREPRMPIEVVEKLWGNEKILHNDQDYCCKVLMIRPGYTSSLHYHKVKRETFYVVSGKVMLYRMSKGAFTVLHVGTSVTLEPGEAHSFRSVGGVAIVVEASSRHSDADVFRIEESRVLADSE